jgi:hypothetical protein
VQNRIEFQSEWPSQVIRIILSLPTRSSAISVQVDLSPTKRPAV